MISKPAQEYNDFMKWFKEKHPILHERFEKNINMPLREGDGVGVSDGFGISAADKEMLLNATSAYYDLKDEDTTAPGI